MIGYDRQSRVVNMGDSAQLNAYLADPDTDDPIDASTIRTVVFTIRKPDGTYDAIDGDVDNDGIATANYQVTDQEGEYIVVAQFTLADGVIRSINDNFQVSDPFGP